MINFFTVYGIAGDSCGIMNVVVVKIKVLFKYQIVISVTEFLEIQIKIFFMVFAYFTVACTEDGEYKRIKSVADTTPKTRIFYTFLYFGHTCKRTKD